MNRNIQPINGSIIESQPGDGTRYGFTLTHSKEWESWFIGPFQSDLKYPCTITQFELDYISQEQVFDIAKRFECNPWTVAEVVRAIHELEDKHEQIPGFPVPSEI